MKKEIINIDELPTQKMLVGGLEIEVKELENGIFAMEDETYDSLGKKIHSGTNEERKEILDFLDKQLFGNRVLPFPYDLSNAKFTAIDNPPNCKAQKIFNENENLVAYAVDEDGKAFRRVVAPIMENQWTEIKIND